MNLDRFKEINDSLGHIVGDQLLTAVAEKICDALGGRGTVSRFGGDAFIILCRPTSREGSAEISEDILAYFREHFAIPDHHLISTSSMGISAEPQVCPCRSELLQQANIEL